MSNCANIINRLFREVCILKELNAKIYLMTDILELNQDIFLGLDELAYLVPDNASTFSLGGIPVSVSINGGAPTASLLLKNIPTNLDAIVTSTKGLAAYGVKTGTGFFDFTKTLPINVLQVDPAILKTIPQDVVVAALKACATSTDTNTLYKSAYEALLSFLSSYGIKNISVAQAACIYQFFINIPKEVTTLDLEVHADNAEEVNFETQAENAESGEGNLEAIDANAPFEPFAPFEPAGPFEPSDIKAPAIYVRQIQDSTTSESISNNEAIELKLRALLEATETSEQTE